ncbi:MAG: hypothetical protein AB7Q30_19855 [Vicinamibacteria bacterium]
MPIGDVILPGSAITAEELRRRYDDLIKEAILRERPDLEVVRADDVSAPGGITTDIFTRLMHSDYVVADITFPNANVFYELGIRHACRPGTILVREKGAPQAPFDVAGLRYLEYENTPSGLKGLAHQLKQRLAWFDVHPGEPDNDFLALAKLTSYRFQSYEKKEEQDASVVFAIAQIAQDPELLQLFLAHASGEPVNQAELIGKLAERPEAFRAVLFALAKSGQLKW